MKSHLVQFYENENFLINGIADYIGPAISSGDIGIVIATKHHLGELERILERRGLLTDRHVEMDGNYIPLEVDNMLPLFMDDGLPNSDRFRKAIGDVITKATSTRPGHVHIFGEMVAILCGTEWCPLRSLGKHDAAIHLERYFNDLLEHFSFSLLCGYPLSAFPRREDAATFREVCDLHTAVRPAESYDPTADIRTVQRTIAELQQQAFSLASEVHARVQIEKALREVNFDRLTGLPNRNVFQDRLEMDIKKAHRGGLPLALLFIDLDNFKEINDTLGHDIGDMLLQQVADRLTKQVCESDTVARLGGDEFTVTVTELRDLDSATDTAQKILHELSRPFYLGSDVVYVSASIGITLYPKDASTVSELLRNADQAMYQSKYLGRNRLTYFTRDMQEAAQTRMALSNDLRHAIAESQLTVFYQPIVELATGKIAKAEALLRWKHPTHGLVSPLDFIPIAEHTGMIIPIGDWIFKTALRQARQWRTRHRDFTISVNVSPAQFQLNDSDVHRDWLAQCNDQNREIGDEMPAVGLEITEGLLLAASAPIKTQLMAFRHAGIKLSLDDFGTGYSSLSYLSKFNLDFLKIDQSFVFNLENEPANIALCEAIIVMAHKLGLKVIAEGIETPQQSQILKQAGCDFGQGYLFGQPVPPDEFEALI